MRIADCGVSSIGMFICITISTLPLGLFLMVGDPSCYFVVGYFESIFWSEPSFGDDCDAL